MRTGRVLAAALGAAALLAPACGPTVVAGAHGASGSGGSTPDAGPTVDAAADANADAAPDALAACNDPATCSRVIAYDGTCLGAATAGTFCDELGTVCAAATLDCAAIGAVVGWPGTTFGCGGTSECNLDFAGNLAQSTVDQLCKAKAMFGVEVDCFLN